MIAREGMTPSMAPMARISRVDMYVMSAEEIRAASVVEVVSPDVLDTSSGLKEGGVSDPAMGGFDARTIRCPTDGNKPKDCPGYFGHVELRVPVFNILFAPVLAQVMSCICHGCGRLMETDDGQARTLALSLSDGEARLSAIKSAMSSRQKCPRCGAPRVRVQGGGVGVSASAALEILEALPRDDLDALGFHGSTHPASMIVQALPVPPPQIRPTVYLDGGRRVEDGLTAAISAVVSANAQLDAYSGRSSAADREGLQQAVERLQQAVDAVMRGDANVSPTGAVVVAAKSHASSAPVGGLRSRISGKEGRVRGNMLGKRVDYSGRSVISGDPNLSIGELGVPAFVARVLTVRETVTPFNIEEMRRTLASGSANSVRKADSSAQIHVPSCDPSDPRLRLEVGDVLHRHLRNGDLVVFNRQPSLHMMSMMAHEVRVLGDGISTFRINVCVTPPYNADFDGDEMNVHVPQSHEARVEMRDLMAVSRNMVSPQSNRPVIGAVQDVLLGLYLMTDKDVFLGRDEISQLVMASGAEGLPPPAVMKPEALWTGKQAASLALPPGLHAGVKSAWAPKEDPDGTAFVSADEPVVVVSGGSLMCGRLCKRAFGASAGGLIHVAWLDLGPRACMEMLDAANRTSVEWLRGASASIGMADMLPSEGAKAGTAGILDEAFREASELSSAGSPEAFVNAVLNSAGSKVAGHVSRAMAVPQGLNSLLHMVRCGSKGSVTNVAQIAGCLGQQNVEGRRIGARAGRDRSLTCFERGDSRPEAMGFVRSSYVDGLSPSEHWFHATGGREGLVDTAVKTASTGYVQRQLIKNVEDVVVHYDGTVRNGRGVVLQWVYGGDGLDASRLESADVPELSWSDSEAASETGWPHPRTESMEREGRVVAEALAEARDCVAPGTRRINLAVSPERESSRSRAARRGEPRMDARDQPWALAALERALDRIARTSPRSRRATAVARAVVAIRMRTRAACGCEGPSRSMSRGAYEDALDAVARRVEASVVQPGEAVGVVAAQSIGEPCTQMCLNTFHFAGVAAKNVTLGIPRLVEIIHCSERIRTPCVTVPLRGASGARFVHASFEDLRVGPPVEVSADGIEGVVGARGRRAVSLAWSLMGVAPDGPCVAVELSTRGSRTWELVAAASSAACGRCCVAATPEIGGSCFLVVGPSDNAGGVMADVMSSTASGVCGVRGFVDGVDRDTWYRREDGGVGSRREPLVHLDCDPDRSSGQASLGRKDRCVMAEVMRDADSDHRGVYSNSVSEVLRVLGVFAAREVIRRELVSVIEFDGSYVDPRHIDIVCDAMTFTGGVTPINRHGHKKTCRSPLSLCSYEETPKTLLHAAAFSRSDALSGVSPNVMFGRRIPTGTGMCDVMVDMGTIMEGTEDEQRSRDGCAEGASYRPYEPTPQLSSLHETPEAMPWEVSPIPSARGGTEFHRVPSELRSDGRAGRPLASRGVGQDVRRVPPIPSARASATIHRVPGAAGRSHGAGPRGAIRIRATSPPPGGSYSYRASRCVLSSREPRSQRR